MSHLWKKVQGEMVDAKNIYKKTLTLFWFPVKDIKIPNLFYKFLKFLGTSWASVITHKDLLDLLTPWLHLMHLLFFKLASSNLIISIFVESFERICWSFRVALSKWINSYGHLLCPPVSCRSRAFSTTSSRASCFLYTADHASTGLFTAQFLQKLFMKPLF